MPVIILQTPVNATPGVCFDLSRSIDLHKITTARSKEESIAGKTSGLINLGEFVTWKATHFGIRQKLTSKITMLDRPFHFRDEQVKGAFKSFTHDHYFNYDGTVVIMKDIFEFKTPFGIFGEIFNRIVLTKYLGNLLIHRNRVIKDYAETEKWKELLK